MKVLIVGGVAGGATAAARLRRLDENAEITILEKSGYVSYANCGLPYYIGGVIEDKRELTLQSPKGFMDRFNIEVRIHSEVTHLNPKKKTVTVKNLQTGQEYEEKYDKLILSPGAVPTMPKISGIDSKNSSEKVFTLRTVEDTFRIREFIEMEKPKSAVLAGGGFISLEMAENLIELGIDVTIVQRSEQLFPHLDKDMAAQVHSLFAKHGVKLKLGAEVTGFESCGDSIKTIIKDRESPVSEMVILAIGVTPDSKLAAEAGLELGIKGSIMTDSAMRTSDADIYAVGDAVSVENSVTGETAHIPLAGPANKQGRTAADNICGGNSTYGGSVGT